MRPASVSLLTLVGDDLYLTMTGETTGGSRPVEVRRYDTTGTMVSSETETFGESESPGLPFGLPNDELFWADRVVDDIRPAAASSSAVTVDLC